MNLQEYQAEYERILRWRDAWGCLSNKFEPGRLQSRQDAIEEKAYQANRRLGALINKFDRQQNERTVHYSRLPTRPALCGAKKPARYPLVTTTTPDSVTCIHCVNLMIVPDNQVGGTGCCSHSDSEHVLRYCTIPECGCRNFRTSSKKMGVVAVAEQLLSATIGKVKPEVYASMVSDVAQALESHSLAAFHRGVDAAKDAVRTEGSDIWEGAQFKPYFITAIARKCGVDRNELERNSEIQ